MRSGEFFSLFPCCILCCMITQNAAFRHFSAPIQADSRLALTSRKSRCNAICGNSAIFSLLCFWRRGRDSNPCGVAPKRFSRPPRYDRFDTSPKKMELLIGVEPMTSSLPRMCSTNWAIAASHLFVFCRRSWRLLYYITEKSICQYFFEIFFKFFWIFFANMID